MKLASILLLFDFPSATIILHMILERQRREVLLFCLAETHEHCFSVTPKQSLQPASLVCIGPKLTVVLFRRVSRVRRDYTVRDRIGMDDRFLFASGTNRAGKFVGNFIAIPCPGKLRACLDLLGNRRTLRSEEILD